MGILNKANKLMTTEINILGSESKAQKIERMQSEKTSKEEALKANPELQEIFDNYEVEIKELQDLQSKLELKGEDSAEQVAETKELITNLKKEQNYIFSVKNEELELLVKEAAEREEKYSEDNENSTDLANTVGAISGGIKGALKHLKYARLSTYATIAVKETYRATTGSPQAMFGMQEKYHLHLVGKEIEQLEDAMILEERSDIITRIIELEEQLAEQNTILLEKELEYKEQQGKRTLFTKLKNVAGVGKEEDKIIIEIQKIIEKLENSKNLAEKELELYENKISENIELLVEQKKIDIEDKRVFELESLQVAREELLQNLGLVNESAISAFMEKHKESIKKYEKSAKIIVDVAAAVYGIYRIANAATILPEGEMDFDGIQDMLNEIVDSTLEDGPEMDMDAPDIAPEVDITPEVEPEVEVEPEPLIDPNAEQVQDDVDKDLEDDHKVTDTMKNQAGEDWNAEQLVVNMDDISGDVAKDIAIANEHEKTINDAFGAVASKNAEFDISDGNTGTEISKLTAEMKVHFENGVTAFMEIDKLDIEIEAEQVAMQEKLTAIEEKISAALATANEHIQENKDLITQKEGIDTEIAKLLGSKSAEGVTMDDFATIDAKIEALIDQKEGIDTTISANIGANHQLDMGIKEDLATRDTMDDKVEGLIADKEKLLDKVQAEQAQMEDIQEKIAANLEHDAEVEASIIKDVDPDYDYGPDMDKDAQTMPYDEFERKYEHVIDADYDHGTIKSEYQVNNLIEGLMKMRVDGGEERAAAYKEFVETHTHAEVEAFHKSLADDMLSDHSVFVSGRDSMDVEIPDAGQRGTIEDIEFTQNGKNSVFITIDQEGQLKGINAVNRALGLPEETALVYRNSAGLEVNNVVLNEQVLRASEAKDIGADVEDVIRSSSNQSGIDYDIVNKDGVVEQYGDYKIAARVHSHQGKDMA